METNEIEQFLSVYYKRLFPFDLYYRWMSYGNLKKNYFTNREFSFQLDGDIVLRYKSFSDKSEFENEVIKCCPNKIDIGPVYNYKPSDRRAIASLQAIERELIFDVDMDEYDEVRTCCKGAKICKKCWTFMQLAMKILHRALTEDFGFEHILWVFSGRRGIHCWVCDESARQLSNSARVAIIQYLSLIQGGEFKQKKVRLWGNIHPSIKKALEILKPCFPQLVIQDQEMLETKEQCDKLISFCQDAKLKEELSARLPSASNSEERWEIFTGIFEKLKKQNKLSKDHLVVEEFMLQMCYMRLDDNVSKQTNHLLKAPFCIHPKTGQVCIPIDPLHVDQFDPLSVPTVSELIEEIDSYDAKLVKDGDAEPEVKIPDYKKTSLASSYKIFQSFLKKLESSWNKSRLAENEAKMEF